MTKRKVVAMAMEKREETGKISYGKRKRTLEKKAQDLSTLCSISVCTLCFDPNGKVDTWPQDPDAVRGILERYTAKRDANQIWELTETETAPAPATNQNQNLDKEKTKKKKKKDNEEEEEKNQNHSLEKDNKNKKKEEEEEEEDGEEKNVTVNHKQVGEDKVERRRSMLRRWETWGSRVEEREDMSQESLMTIAKALDYKLQIANGMIGLKEMAKRTKLGICIGDSAGTGYSCSTAANETAHRYQDLRASQGIYSGSSGTTPVGDGSSSSHDRDNDNDDDSNLVLGDRNSNFAASRPPQFFQFF